MSTDAKAYLDGLSEEQAIAAKKTDDPVMVIAGAGSGKTRTLVGRIIHLLTPVEEGGLGADPSSIMMVTFTNKAAREMRERILPVIQSLREKNPKMQGGEPWIGTFHGLSLRILRVEAARAGLGGNFSIFDEADARSLAKDVAENLGLDAFDVDDFFRDLEFAKARLLSHELLAQKHMDLEIAREMGEDFDQTMKTWARILGHFETPSFTRMYSAYQRALESQNAVDFSDLMNRVTKLFKENEDVRLSWMSSFRHFMVDEVQDINKAQIAWLNMLTNGGAEVAIPDGVEGSDWSNAGDGGHEVNTFRLKRFPRATFAAVGDYRQSIYAFRGSDPKVLEELMKRYQGMEVTYLTQSYRCQPSILSVSNTLVENNSSRFRSDVVPNDPHRRASRVVIEEHVSPNDEIRRIVAEANAHIAAGKAPDQFAVLVRTRDLVKVVAKELRAIGLPVTEGKASDIRKTAEVRDAMAFAGFITNADAEVYLKRIINKPARGLGPTSMARVVTNAKEKGISLTNEIRSIMNDKVDLPDGCEGYKPAFVRNLKNFGLLIGEVKKDLANAGDAGDAIFRILEVTGYLPELKADAMKSAGIPSGTIDMTLKPREFLAALIRENNQKNNKGAPKGADAQSKEHALLVDMDAEELADRAGALSENARRIGNLSMLIEQASAVPTLESFMQEATLEMEQKVPTAGIQVMTVHGSKGLEFDVVRLPFWIEGVFPHGRAVEGGETEEIEEERRLAYVALTRAKEDVRISRSWKLFGCPYIRTKNSIPSRFIKEIQESPREAWRFAKIKPTDPIYKIGVVQSAPVQVQQKDPAVMDLYGRGASAAPAPAPLPAAPIVDTQSYSATDKRRYELEIRDRYEAMVSGPTEIPEDPMGDMAFAPISEYDLNFVPDTYNDEMEFAPYPEDYDVPAKASEKVKREEPQTMELPF